MVRALLTLVGLTVVAAAIQAQSLPPNTPKSSWVKLCDTGTVTAKDNEGKDVEKKVNICNTFAERIDATTGKVILHAGLNQVRIDKEEKLIFRVILPLEVVLPAGIRVTFFPKDLWAKVEKNEKLEKDDEPKLEQVKMSFLFCNAVGCHIEAEAKEDLVKELKTAAGFIVTTSNMSDIGVNLRVPLAGFNAALKGPPTDTKKFAEARKKLMDDIPRYDRPIRCDTVVDDLGPCSAKSLLKR